MTPPRLPLESDADAIFSFKIQIHRALRYNDGAHNHGLSPWFQEALMKDGLKTIPTSLYLVLSFLFFLSCSQITILLLTCAYAEEPREILILHFLFHTLLALLSLLLAIQLMLHVPFARICALMFFLLFPLIKGINFVVSPLAWHKIGTWGRAQELVSAVILIVMAGLLFRPGVTKYLSSRVEPEKKTPRRVPDSPPPAPSQNTFLDQ